MKKIKTPNHIEPISLEFDIEPARVLAVNDKGT